MEAEKPEQWKNESKFWQFLSLITVEPTLFLYMLAFMITTVVEQAFFVDKACRVNHRFNSTICDNIEDEQFKEYNKEVQSTVSNFYIQNEIFDRAVQITLALFMGAWSDKRGRKWPLLLGLIGKLYYSLMIVVNSLQPTWPVENVVYTATFPMAFTGADVAIFAAAFTYLVDVSTVENRTLRITLLEVSYLATMPTGIALGSYLFTKVTRKSFAIMFAINAALMTLSIIYTLVRLEWRTNPKQRPLKEASNVCADFFDVKHVVATFKTLFRTRPGKLRCHLLFLVVATALFAFQRDERKTNYLYMQLVMKWDFGQISNFRIFQSGVQDIVMVCAVPVMTKILSWKDATIVLLGAICHIIGRFVKASTEQDWLFYLGGLFVAVGPIGTPVLKSMVSKIITTAEKGKIFSILSIAANAIPLISGVLYSLVYKLTIDVQANAIFFLTIVTQVLVLVLVGFVHLTTKSYTIEEKDGELVATKKTTEEAGGQSP